MVERGVSRESIRRRARAAELYPLGCDVFALGHRKLADDGWRHAALLGAGEGSVLSHWTAATIWGLTSRRHARVHVSTRRRTTTRRMPGITIHRPREVSGDLERYAGYRVTSIFRTLLDLTAEVTDAQLRRMVEMAITKHHIDPTALVKYGHARRRRKGGTRLARAAGAVAGRVVLRSDLEETFRSFCEEHGLPAYETNVPFGRWELDVFWRTHGVAVELDWYCWHGAQSNYRRDRKKGLAVQAAGLGFARVAGEDLEEDPGAVLRGLLALLERAGTADA